MGEPQAITLRPTSQMYPEIDGPAARLVEVMEQRGWEVPGVKVEFYSYGLGTRVGTIAGDGWRVHYGRPQGRRGNWNDTAAVDRIVFGRKGLGVYDDWSGPTFSVYVGPDPVPEHFGPMHGLNEKLHGRPRTTLQYNGSDYPDKFQWRLPRTLAPYLLHSNDIGRMYDPEGDEPRMYLTADVMREMGQEITRIVESIEAKGQGGQVATSNNGAR
jgi:hypothetical protein